MVNLEQIDEQNPDYNTVVTTYRWDRINTVEELFEFLDDLEMKLGLVRILCTQTNEKGLITGLKIADNLKELKRTLDRDFFSDLSELRSGVEEISVRSLIMDFRNKTLSITGILNREYVEKPENITYYMFNNMYPVKMDKGISAFYEQKEDGKWKEIPHMIDSFVDGIYPFEEITEEEALEFYRIQNKKKEEEEIYLSVLEFPFVRYCKDENGMIYRDYGISEVDFWDENNAKWVEVDPDRRYRIASVIEGYGDDWISYTDIDVMEAWDIIKNFGGTKEEFSKIDYSHLEPEDENGQEISFLKAFFKAQKRNGSFDYYKEFENLYLFCDNDAPNVFVGEEAPVFVNKKTGEFTSRAMLRMKGRDDWLKNVIEEGSIAERIACNISVSQINDSLYSFEHQFIPERFYKDGIMFLAAIASKDNILNKLFHDMISEEVEEDPYPEVSINVEKKISGSVIYDVITFPDPPSAPLCYEAIAMIDLLSKRSGYYCLEKSIMENDMPVLCGWTADGKHVNYGSYLLDKKEFAAKVLEMFISTEVREN